MDEKAFWANVDWSGGPDACWPWTRYKKVTGYGGVKIGGRVYRAHRIAYVFANGQIPKGMCVCHRCDNPSCCNPRHLFLGTHSENMKDAAAKGRFASRCGSHCSGHKLTESDVLQIRSLATTGLGQKEIGVQFGVTQCVISTIVRRTAWKHI